MSDMRVRNSSFIILHSSFFFSFPVNLPTAKYPPFDSTSYVTGPCKMTLALVS